MDYLIRVANINDLDSIVKLWEKLSIDQMSKDPYYKGDLVFSGGYSQFKQALNSDNCCIFVAEVNNIVIGFIEVWLYQKDFYFFIDDYAYILHFFIDPDARRSENILSIIYNLFEAALNWAIEKGSQYIIADAFAHNIRIMKLLEKVGFESYRIRYVKELGSK
ncbi:GCN5-related N-acetyltransferase [Thermoanaerobacter italicus Ab9]|uniref:GCN5-related N-acetyltransferase n=1 Tax=Thermoanaerobacter italicus (strain DSM 9252 / Ab9) TaxID=580331 RepID=D3T6Y1_THEIA|nr:GNAT family N-acetyltransferase [Thermoanaerobacter italicus]ADD01713.1 GCN5-related N-acetyltransferase [Thermoanaerobacter italicus Ab9]